MQGRVTLAGRLAGRLSGLYGDSGATGEVLIDRLAYRLRFRVRRDELARKRVA